MPDLMICVITNNYPEPRFVEMGVFIENLVREWQERGNTVHVVAPRSLTMLIRTAGYKKERIRIAGDRIERPLFISLSNRRIGPVDLRQFSRTSFHRAVADRVRKLPVPKFFYGKFLMYGGLAALNAGRRHNRPTFADLGESSLIERLTPADLNLVKQRVPLFSGFVCVSERLVEEVIYLGADPDRVLLAPNTVDTNLFHPQDRISCRRRLGLPEEEFIVAFTGHFIERKGPLRVLKAIESLDIPVKALFLGRGEQKPAGGKVLFAGAVSHNELPIWLNAADVFVLPTLAEGNCNAINEAMACGLPVISSDIPDIRFQVPDSSGILVNPMNIEEIASAIRLLATDNEKKEKMHADLISNRQRLGQEKRSDRILAWIEERL